ncbi:hypothetical protein HBI53_150690 [Parastagonospora nodorum]|nr:hypothetical protein HBI53_150690 [Parastagonospora nodorum]
MSETALVTTTAALGLVRVYDDGDAKLIVTLSSERLAPIESTAKRPATAIEDCHWIICRACSDLHFFR